MFDVAIVVLTFPWYLVTKSPDMSVLVVLRLARLARIFFTARAKAAPPSPGAPGPNKAEPSGAEATGAPKAGSRPEEKPASAACTAR